MGLVIFVLRWMARLRHFLFFGAALLLAALIANSSENRNMLYTALFLGLIALVFAVLSALPRMRPALFDWNGPVKSRVEVISALIRECRETLVIVSGEFYHEVFDSDPVRSALHALSPDVKIYLYMTKDRIDPKSVKFNNWVNDRKLDIVMLRTAIKHRIIVDGKSGRIEFKDDRVANRPAFIFRNEVRFARMLMDGLSRAQA